MKTELLIELLNDLIATNERSLIDYKADGNIPMQQFCIGKIQAYENILGVVSQLSACLIDIPPKVCLAPCG